MQDLTFEQLCGVLREEFGSARVSSPQHPRVGDGDPLTGDLILREDGPSVFLVVRKIEDSGRNSRDSPLSPRRVRTSSIRCGRITVRGCT